MVDLLFFDDQEDREDREDDLLSCDLGGVVEGVEFVERGRLV